MSVKTLSSSLAILLLCSVSQANETTSLEQIKVTTASLGEEQNIEDVQASIEVLDEKFIEQSKAKSVPQLLNNAFGLYVNDTGSTSSVSIRGFSSTHTLILVDGMRRTGKYGTFDLTSIQLEDIQRVEIVRGPMSALYGADGIAGVINIITKKNPKKDYVKATLIGGAAQNGQRETYIAKLNGTNVQENISHSYSIELREKNDYRSDKSSISTDLKKESKQFLSYTNGINLNDNNSLNTRLEYARQDDKGINYDNSELYEKEDRYQVSTQYKHINDDFIFDTNLSYGYSNADVQRGTGSEITKYKQLEFNNYFRHFTNDEMSNILGAGYKRDDIEVSMYSKDASRDNFNVLFQNEYYLSDSLVTNFGLRYDDFSDFGDTLNPKVSIMYTLSDLKFRASYGEAFKAPSFTDMYSHFTRSAGPILYDISGSENLKPEESRTYEFAITYNKDNFDFEIIHHRSKLDNLISTYTSSYDASTKTNYTTYQNIDKSQINGTEISARYSFENGFGLNLGWEYLDTKDNTTNERLTGSAQTTLKMKLSYEINDLSFFLNVKKYNNFYSANTSLINVNSDYTVADLNINYKITKQLEWFVGIDNIQDRQMPYNMTSRGTPNDPAERFYYTGMNITF